MTSFTAIPKQVEAELEKHETSRRNFLRGAGLFVVSLSSGLPATGAETATVKKIRRPVP